MPEQCSAYSVTNHQCSKIVGHYGKHTYRRYFTNVNGNIKFHNIRFSKELLSND